MDITIKNLTKYYNQQSVLNINSFSIKQGSFLGIIGPNGAGKSTLTRILAGLDTPSSGEVLYNNSSLNPSISKNITMVFQKPYLIRTTVFNNISYPLKIRKVNPKEIKERVNHLIQEMDIENIKYQNAWTLSGGEAQKVALARAIIFKPSLLILDEPTASIDPASIFMMEKTIKNFHVKTNTTLIMVTHNLQQAKRLCSDVAFMYKGSIFEYGKTNDVILSPQNELTRRFMKGEIVL